MAEFAVQATPPIAWTEFRPRTPTDAPEPHALMRQAFAIGLPDWLRRAAAHGRPALLLVNDSHRATVTRPALAVLAEFQAQLGLSALQWNVLVSAGTHAFPPAERGAFETATWSNCGLNIVASDWNEALNAEQHVDVGGFGLHRWIPAHRCILALGSVEPHYFAGLTGAHKTLTIGCMLRTDIERNHAGALAATSDLLALEGNPVYDGIAEAVRAVRTGGADVLGVNQIVADGRLLACQVGDVLETLHTLAPLVRETFLHEITAPFDILQLDVPPPLGRSLYQADKALKNNHTAVRDGGGIILCADCDEGVGPDAFFSLLRSAGTYAAACEQVRRRGYRLGDHKAVKLRHLTDPAARGVRVALVSRHVSQELALTAGLQRCDSTAEALHWLQRELGGRLHAGGHIHDAGNVGVALARPAAAR